MNDNFAPVVVALGPDGFIRLRLKQLDGTHRLAFSCEAAELVEAIDRGEAEAASFGLGLLADLPVSAEAAGRARRYQVELALALTWAWVDVEAGDEPLPPDLWTGGRPAIARLIRDGDPQGGVAPISAYLGRWFNGPLVEMSSEGER